MGFNTKCECNALDTGCDEILFKLTVIATTTIYTTNNENNKGIWDNLTNEIIIFIGIVLSGICLLFIENKKTLIQVHKLCKTWFVCNQFIAIDQYINHI